MSSQAFEGSHCFSLQTVAAPSSSTHLVEELALAVNALDRLGQVCPTHPPCSVGHEGGHNIRTVWLLLLLLLFPTPLLLLLCEALQPHIEQNYQLPGGAHCCQHRQHPVCRPHCQVYSIRHNHHLRASCSQVEQP